MIKHNKYTYICYENKTQLWRQFWEKIDLFYYIKFDYKIFGKFLERRKELERVAKINQLNFLIKKQKSQRMAQMFLANAKIVKDLQKENLINFIKDKIIHLVPEIFSTNLNL